MSDETAPLHRDEFPKAAMPEADLDPAADAKILRFPIEFFGGIELDAGPEWLIKGLMPTEGLQVLYGVPGTGKSFIALDAALHVASGRRWMGRKVRQAGVVYVAAEAGRGMRKRIVAARRHHGLPSSLPLALVTAAPQLGFRDGDADLLAKEIAAQLPEDFRLGLIVVDTLARTMAGGDESGSAGMGTFIDNVERLGAKVGALVVVVHHSGKDLDRGMRGSSALVAASNAVWRIMSDKQDAGLTLLHVEKMKEEEGKFDLPFTLQRFDLEPDRDGEPRSSCVVSQGPALVASSQPGPEPAAPSPAPRNREPSPGQTAFRHALSVVIERHGTPTKRFRHIPQDVKVLRQADLADLDDYGIAAESTKSRKAQIDRYVRALEAEGLLRRHDGYVWLTVDPDLTLPREKQAA